MAAGIVLTAASGTAWLSGLLVFAAGSLAGSISDNEETLAAVLMVGGAIGAATGVVMIVVGGERVPVRPGHTTSLAPRLLLAPTRVGLAFSF
jgi:hypothetical protein